MAVGESDEGTEELAVGESDEGTDEVADDEPSDGEELDLGNATVADDDAAESGDGNRDGDDAEETGAGDEPAVGIEGDVGAGAIETEATEETAAVATETETTVDSVADETVDGTTEAETAGGAVADEPTASEATAEAVEDDDGDEATGGRDESTLQVLEFVLTGATYAVTIGEVGAIVEMKDITRFPRGPGPVDGVTDLRGEITAVLDPKRLLDVETNGGPSRDDYIVVLDRTEDKQKVAIRVDDVVRVEKYVEHRIDRNGDLSRLEVDSLEANMVDGIIHKDIEDGIELVPWLNIDAIVEGVE
jgi:purine-binding chemotaxis protein CheW